MFPALETERLLLREIVEDDVQEIFNCFTNSDMLCYYGQEPLTSIEQAKELIRSFEKNYHEKRGIRWGIQVKDQKELIGTIGFNLWSPKHKRAEIGYELHPNYWRMGYAAEAVSEIISFGFNELNFTRIGAVVFIENQSSNKLLTNLRFEKEGVLRNYMYQDGVPFDTYVYSLLNPDLISH
ncbi:GNAT family protein [Bacillus sp. DTU_2020_1000418_1_SI_GHA_SEK_038]|uniref:GNAT family N-acetyltransferase n=1 Tax=Bacillus sp. DTU_2020_1000418_1_SI_GHA_SEK_038 TaxID=3077585 RepID=UPI0028F11BA9|nr:GNAT family protein [Bacillus sp. DTU_2020_1000418_1_SI_GHA_SEK_038]WNS75796.1 GNAT family protein [Bacillus sp. DTU_2020_1000418_1_SI_GHA_SEK_038]